MSNQALLSDDQKDVLHKLIEATKRTGPKNRRKFQLWHTRGLNETHIDLEHPGWDDADPSPYIGDLEALRDVGFITWAWVSPDVVEFDVTARGSSYFEHINQPPQYDARQQLQRVIGVIARQQQANRNQFTSDTVIADELGMDIDEVRAYMDELHALGLTMEANTRGGHASMLKGKGILAAKDPSYFQPASNTTINYSGDFKGAILNVNSTLSSVTQTIGASQSLSEPDKHELSALVQELLTSLQHMPTDKADDAEAVAESAKDLVEAVSKDKPNKTRVLVTAEGLKQAAQNIASVSTTLMPVVLQIVEVASRVVR